MNTRFRGIQSKSDHLVQLKQMTPEHKEFEVDNNSIIKEVESEQPPKKESDRKITERKKV